MVSYLTHFYIMFLTLICVKATSYSLSFIYHVTYFPLLLWAYQVHYMIYSWKLFCVDYLFVYFTFSTCLWRVMVQLGSVIPSYLKQIDRVIFVHSMIFLSIAYLWHQLSWNLLPLFFGMFEVAIKNQYNVINYYITSPYYSNNVWNEYSYSTITYDNYLQDKYFDG